MAGAFSGLLASAILHMDGIGGKRGWAWVFILVSRNFTPNLNLIANALIFYADA